MSESKISLEELRQLLSTMKPRTILYEIVKAEMKKRGRWKNLPRGRAGFYNQKR